MPPLPRIRSASLSALGERLERESPSRLLKLIEAGEALAAEIDSGVDYPIEWVAFRLTGARSKGEDAGALPGDALLADLGALVERLSWSARLDETGLIDAADLAVRWGVSRKTLDRYRRRGLPARRVMGENAKPRTVFSPAVIAAFERTRSAELARAGGFTRLDDPSLLRILRDARRYSRAGLSRNEASRRIALRARRAHETIRGILQRHDDHAHEPIFPDRGPPTPRERRFIERAVARWIDVDLIAKRIARPRRAVARIAIDARAQRLRDPAITPRFTGLDASRLSHASVIAGLGAPGERDVAALLAACRRAPVPLGVEERARAIAYHALIERAAASIATLPSHGVRAGQLDRIETDLRWASRLKAELIRSQLALLVRSLEGRLPVPLDHVRAADLWPLLRASILAIADAVTSFDPSRGGRLAAPAGLGVDRVAVAWLRGREAARPGSAQPRLTLGYAIEDWTRLIDPWQPIVEPPAWVMEACTTIDPAFAGFLQTRFGVTPPGGKGAGPPRTLDELGQANPAARAGMSRVRPALLERRALRAAREAIRG